ncbi:hypothetical protein [Thermoanaerobacter mathranii]|uniref:hypothetical protein n=1 Tax=Thermoanaerobacter mathranii TaxID=583357 RepID=UPI003D6B3879
MRSKVGISVECILKGERTKDLANIIEAIYRTESTISNADEYVPYMLPLKIMNALEDDVIFVNDFEYIDNEKVLYVEFIDTDAVPKLSFYSELAKFYDLKLYLSAVCEDDEIFFNTDEEGEYFPEKYYFNIYLDFVPRFTSLLEKLGKILEEYGVYYSDLEPFQENLKEYGIETEEDMYSLQSYLQSAYPSVTVYFSHFVNPLSKK